MLTCSYEKMKFFEWNVKLLVCFTKLPLFEVYMYPIIEMNFS